MKLAISSWRSWVFFLCGPAYNRNAGKQWKLWWLERTDTETPLLLKGFSLCLHPRRLSKRLSITGERSLWVNAILCQTSKDLRNIISFCWVFQNFSQNAICKSCTRWYYVEGGRGYLKISFFQICMHLAGELQCRMSWSSPNAQKKLRLSNEGYWVQFWVLQMKSSKTARLLLLSAGQQRFE